MEFNKLIYEVNDGVGIIELNSPKNYNALNEELINELLDAFKAANDDNEVKVVVLKGNEKSFSAGGDLGSFYQVLKNDEPLDENLFTLIWSLSDFMRRMDKLIVAEVSGVAAGAGVSLAFSCDFIISTEDTKFIESFANVNLTPDMGSVYLLAKDLGWHRAMELVTLAEPIRAKELADAHVIYKLVESDKLSDETLKFAKRLAKGPVLAYRNNKRLIYEAVFSDYEKFHGEESKSSNELAKTEDFKNAVIGFVEKKEVEFKGR